MVVEKTRVILGERKGRVNKQKRELYNQKTAIEQKRDTAEEKLLEGIISDEDFTRIRKKFKEELDSIHERLAQLEEQREVKVDEIQKILRFARNIHFAYKNAPYILKRHYLSFFWERFETKDKKIVKAEPTKLFKALLDSKKVIIRNSVGG